MVYMASSQRHALTERNCLSVAKGVSRFGNFTFHQFDRGSSWNVSSRKVDSRAAETRNLEEKLKQRKTIYLFCFAVGIRESDFCKLPLRIVGKSRICPFANKCCYSGVLQDGAAAVKASELHIFFLQKAIQKMLTKLFLVLFPYVSPKRAITEIRTIFPTPDI